MYTVCAQDLKHRLLTLNQNEGGINVQTMVKADGMWALIISFFFQTNHKIFKHLYDLSLE